MFWPTIIPVTSAATHETMSAGQNINPNTLIPRYKRETKSQIANGAGTPIPQATPRLYSGSVMASGKSAATSKTGNTNAASRMPTTASSHGLPVSVFRPGTEARRSSGRAVRPVTGGLRQRRK
jgi:hypothetical protein